MTICYQCQGTNVGPLGTLRRGNGHVTGSVPFLLDGDRVRALTPLEGERLSALPDGHTAGFAPSVRHQMLGDIAIPTMVDWLYD